MFKWKFGNLTHLRQTLSVSHCHQHIIRALVRRARRPRRTRRSGSTGHSRLVRRSRPARHFRPRRCSRPTRQRCSRPTSFKRLALFQVNSRFRLRGYHVVLDSYQRRSKPTGSFTILCLSLLLVVIKTSQMALVTSMFRSRIH